MPGERHHRVVEQVGRGFVAGAKNRRHLVAQLANIHRLAGFLILGQQQHIQQIAVGHALLAALLDDAGNVARTLFDGEGDQSFDVAGTECGAYGDHLHLVVGDVGHGIDGEARDLVGTEADEPEHEQ